MEKLTVSPCMAAMRLTMDNPRPLPAAFCPGGRKKRSPSLGICSGARFAHAFSIYSLSWSNQMRICPPAGDYRIALSNRLRSKMPVSAASPRTASVRHVPEMSCRSPFSSRAAW